MKLSRIFVTAGITFLLVSLVLPGVNGMWGLVSVVFGAASVVFDPPWAIVWLANPLIAVAIYLRVVGKSPAWQRILPLIAVACALYALQAESIVTSDAGTPHTVTLTWGYWSWITGMALFATGALIAVHEEVPDAADHQAIPAA